MRGTEQYRSFSLVEPFLAPYGLWPVWEREETQKLRSILRRIEIDEEKLFKCMKVNQLLMTPVTSQFDERFKELIRFEVPYSLSPQLQSEPLDEVIRTARWAAVLPLTHGIMSGTGYASQGQYAVALAQTGIGAGQTIIVVCGCQIAQTLVNYLRAGKSGKE